jgi:hypothetical protein
VVFDKHAHPSINVVHSGIGRGKFRLHAGIRSDLGKRGEGRQTIIETNLIKPWQPLIPPALHVKRGQVEPGCGGRREVPHCINDQAVDFLRSLAGKTAQIGFDPDAGDLERFEKVLAQEKVADRLIVGIKP